MHGTIAVDDLKINALEGRSEDYGGPEILPAKWCAPHVERRLIEAHETLMADRSHIGPKEFGEPWPAGVDEYAVDVAAARAFRLGLADDNQTRRAAAMGWNEINRVCRDGEELSAQRSDPPTVAQITHMEAAIGWPWKYLGRYHPQLLNAVQRITRAKALGRDADWVALHLGGPSAEVWQSRCWAGCERIAWGLDRERVVVF